ncbi:hypothetical protein [Naasia sp. SYSU D00057]|uniref:hypothetical protein n=1 Tax=Naasia sp. SYSU D00057 TaxID=2817380 RepID=UPI001B3024DE|nr:hypothetical protein [Naasia sp. SYSU D00057]
MLRGSTHPADHSPILAAALFGSLVVLGGIVPGRPAAVPLPTVDIPSLARPGVTLLGILDVIENGMPECELVRAQLIGNGGAELNALRTAYPRSDIVVARDRDARREELAQVLVCPR